MLSTNIDDYKGMWENPDKYITEALIRCTQFQGTKGRNIVQTHDIRGNIVKAFVILKEGMTGNDELVKELQQYVKQLTAPYKYPRKIEFVESLPKTDSGKIRRIELRNRIHV